MTETLALAIAAARDKKAEGLVALDLREVSSFTDYFLICHGRNPRHVQAIAANVEKVLGRRRIRPRHVEGFRHAEWVLLDYTDFVVHVFGRERRTFLQLERLWGDAPRLDTPEATVDSPGDRAIDNRSTPH